jgi:transposase-like protein
MTRRKRKKPGPVGGDKSEIVAALPRACSDELAAVEFMERQRWGDSPACPRCGATDVFQMMGRDHQRNRRFLWGCRGCAKQFTVRIGTVFEDSRIPLKHWCYAFWAACASKKGVSALQIKRVTGLSYKSALFLMHRIRFAMTPERSARLEGTVEVDETYVGGKPRQPSLQVMQAMTYQERKPFMEARKSERGWGTKKAPVVALVERGGRVRTRVVADVSGKTLKRVIRESVRPSAAIHTDELGSYRGIGDHFAGGHHTVRHSVREYARRGVHVNTAESFFSLLKRGLIGTFHAVSRRHLHRYVNEFAFRWNHRTEDDGARTLAAIQGAEGKRLMYREPRGR